MSYNFNDLKQKIIALKKFVSQNNFSLLVSNLARGLDGKFDNDLKQPSLLYSTRSDFKKSLNNYDMIYKKHRRGSVQLEKVIILQFNLKL